MVPKIAAVKLGVTKDYKRTLMWKMALWGVGVIDRLIRVGGREQGMSINTVYYVHLWNSQRTNLIKKLN